MRWDLTVQQATRLGYASGCWDTLRAVLDAADQEPGHECHGLEFARRMYRDPSLFDQFVRDSQARREAR